MEPAAARSGIDLTCSTSPDHLQSVAGARRRSACGKALGRRADVDPRLRAALQRLLGSADSGREAFVEGILEGQPEPPLYFGRMKQENATAPPQRCWDACRSSTPPALGAWRRAQAPWLIDTRRDRAAYLAGALARLALGAVGWRRLPRHGRLLRRSPRSRSSSSASLAGDADARALYRIGLDNVVGIASPETLATALGDHAATIPSGDWDTVRQRMNEPAVEVLDVRRASEFAAGAVAGARNIAHTRLRARLDELDRSKRLLVHCRTGHRATAAVSYLERQGFDVVHIGSKIMDWPATAAPTKAGAEVGT